jgi:Holliday junction resolvase RusA-like endonuclease
MDELTFWVPGIPQPGGSKRGFFNHKTGHVIITEDAKRSKDWRASVSQAASQVAKEMLTVPLKVRFDFVFPRPKGHFGTGKNAGVLRKTAPAFPAGRPDVLKCSRSTEDALTGILWRDDSQIVTEMLTKRYGDQAGAWIRVREAE